MGDLPTREDIRHHLFYDIKAMPSTKAVRHVGEVLTAFADGDLLTREEAANDPEVQRMVRDSLAAKWPLGVDARWVTDDE